MSILVKDPIRSKIQSPQISSVTKSPVCSIVRPFQSSVWLEYDQKFSLVRGPVRSKVQFG